MQRAISPTFTTSPWSVMSWPSGFYFWGLTRSLQRPSRITVGNGNRCHCEVLIARSKKPPLKRARAPHDGSRDQSGRGYGAACRRSRHVT